MPSREDLIVDGDSDEGNDCEQSDMVQVLLNMAFAPKEVVRDFVFGPGISTSFKAAMQNNVLIDWSVYAQEETAVDSSSKATPSNKVEDSNQ